MREFKGRFSVRLASALTMIADVQRAMMTFSKDGYHPNTGATPIPRVLSAQEKTAFNAAIAWMTKEIRRRVDLSSYTVETIKELDLPQWVAASNIFTGAYRAATTEYDNSSDSEFGTSIPPVAEPRKMTRPEVDLYHACLALITKAFEAEVPEYEFLTDSYLDHDDEVDLGGSDEEDD